MKKANLTSSTKIHILTADRSYNVAVVPRPDMAADNAVCFEVCDDAGAPRFCTGDFIFCTAEGNGWRAVSTIADETNQARMEFYADRRQQRREQARAGEIASLAAYISAAQPPRRRRRKSEPPKKR